MTFCGLAFPAQHTSHLSVLPEEEINRLLGMVVDVENIFMSMHRESDSDNKSVYYYLFKVYKTICRYFLYTNL